MLDIYSIVLSTVSMRKSMSVYWFGLAVGVGVLLGSSVTPTSFSCALVLEQSFWTGHSLVIQNGS